MVKFRNCILPALLAMPGCGAQLFDAETDTTSGDPGSYIDTGNLEIYGENNVGPVDQVTAGSLEGTTAQGKLTIYISRIDNSKRLKIGDSDSLDVYLNDKHLKMHRKDSGRSDCDNYNLYRIVGVQLNCVQDPRYIFDYETSSAENTLKVNFTRRHDEDVNFVVPVPLSMVFRQPQPDSIYHMQSEDLYVEFFPVYDLSQNSFQIKICFSYGYGKTGLTAFTTSYTVVAGRINLDTRYCIAESGQPYDVYLILNTNYRNYPENSAVTDKWIDSKISLQMRVNGFYD